MKIALFAALIAGMSALQIRVRSKQQQDKIFQGTAGVDNNLLQQMLDLHVSQLSEYDVHNVPNSKGVVMEKNGQQWAREHFDCRFIKETLAGAQGPLYLFGDSQTRHVQSYLTSVLQGNECLCNVNGDYEKKPSCNLHDHKKPGNLGVSLEADREIPLPVYGGADGPGSNQTDLQHFSKTKGLSLVVWGQSLHYLHGYRSKGNSATQHVKLDYLKDRKQHARDMRSVYKQAADSHVPLVVFRTGNPTCIKGEKMHFTNATEDAVFLAWCKEKDFTEDNCRDLVGNDHGQKVLANIMENEASAIRKDAEGKNGPLVLFVDNLKLYGSKCPANGKQVAQGHWPNMLSLEVDVLMHVLFNTRQTLG